jgi:hypothetical protein
LIYCAKIITRPIIGEQLDLEALYNNLAMILSHNKRPEYKPEDGLSLKDIEAKVSHLEVCEQVIGNQIHRFINHIEIGEESSPS